MVDTPTDGTTTPSGNTSKEHARIDDAVARWQGETLPKALRKLGMNIEDVDSTPVTPNAIEDLDYVRDIGLPGEYPFTSWLYPTRALKEEGDTRIHRAGRYSGFGTSEDCRDYYIRMRDDGMRSGGANIASDLPSQLGWDSDDPRSRGEVGRVGVAIDSLRDFEIVYEAFAGENGIDKVGTNWTINAPAIVYVAFYCALATKQGVPWSKLRCTPQNDILKEYCGRGQYIFPAAPSMRLVRDVITFMDEHMPLSNPISICAEHIRYAGATTPEGFAFSFANAKAYVQLGIDAGLDVDRFVKRFTFRGFGHTGLDFMYGLAAPRAARRIWARIMREDFGAKDDRTCMLRGGEHAWGNAYLLMSAQRPANNIVRASIEALIQTFASGEISGGHPFDEPLGLGHSIEAQQISRDVARIIQHEAGASHYLDPFAGSYVLESLTDQIEAETLEELKRVEDLGGAVVAVESGYYMSRIAQSAWQSQARMESGEDVWVGVNAFNGPGEITVDIQRTSEYDQVLLESAEVRQVAALKELRRERDDEAVQRTLSVLRTTAENEAVNLIPALMDCALAYATIGEICDTLRDVFGEGVYTQ
ncbi:MAG: methylmalonyl-CoA mutase [Marmoricola sp.]|nr:methylmalonyl-CoA mutase [Marmoricola sp.]